MAENKGKMDQLFSSGHSCGSPRQLCVSKPTVDWVVPLCPGTHTPPAPKNAKRNWFLSLNGKSRNPNTLRTFVSKNQTRSQSPENGAVEKYQCCHLETSSADITATSGKTVDCIVIWQAGHSPKTIQPTTSPQRTVTLWSQEAQAVFPDSWIAWWQPGR